MACSFGGTIALTVTATTCTWYGVCADMTTTVPLVEGQWAGVFRAQTRSRFSVRSTPSGTNALWHHSAIGE